ncbi:hypothetical protein LTR17_026774 [Elasticomyces elasticus]|nr:hypothetical protein LTR17_026774 [Elasticomyces elasticus]
MPSPFSTDKTELCGHTKYRPFCAACCAQDTQGELEEAQASLLKHGAAEQHYEALLKDTTLSVKDRDSYNFAIVREQALMVDWDARCEALKEEMKQAGSEVRQICDQNEPSELAAAFENAAVEEEDGDNEGWIAETARAVPTFVLEDATRVASSSGLDRAKIPATQDWVLQDPLGAQVLMRHGKKQNLQLWQAIGEDRSRPAVMSYGAGIEMFGPPFISSAGPEEPGEENSLAAGLETCSIADKQESPDLITPLEADIAREEAELAKEEAEIAKPETAPEIETELDYRVAYKGQDRVGPMSTVDEWKNFVPSKHLLDLANLAHEYCGLVAEKERLEEKAQEEENERLRLAAAKSAEPTEPAADNNAQPAPASTSTTGWPSVGKLTWSDFADWVQRCRTHVTGLGFSAVMKQWRATQKALADDKLMLKSLSEWKPPAEFDDGSKWGQPDPKTYYHHDKMLGQIDIEKLGLKISHSTVYQ